MELGVSFGYQMPRPWYGTKTKPKRYLNALDQAEFADIVGSNGLWAVEHRALTIAKAPKERLEITDDD